MSYKNPYAKPNNPYSNGGASSSSASSSNPYASAYPAQPTALPAAGPVYPGYIAPPSAVARPSIPSGYGGYDANLAQQASIYTPDATQYGGVAGAGPSASGSGAAAGKKGKPRTTVLRKGGGEVWEDQSLLEWDPGEQRTLLETYARSLY
jgi:hypothetical protein